MKYLLIFTSMIFANLLNGQQSEPLVQTIYSDYLETERAIWISFPKNSDGKKTPCHVLYLLDGDQIQMSETIRAIRNNLFESGGYIRPLIIVGIEQVNRSRELSAGGKTGLKFFDFIDKEVIPFIDGNYNTVNDRIIAGHSLGGYYALSVWMKSDKISSCFAFSPAIFNKENKISKDLDTYLTISKPKGLVYVNVGTESNVEQKIQKYMPELSRVFKKHESDTLLYHFKEYEGYGHNFTPIVGITDGLLFHFAQWQFDDEVISKLWDKELEPIATYDKWCEDLDGWAGFKVKRNGDLLGNLAGYYNRTGDIDKALELADYAITVDPLHWFGYYNKGEILLEKDRPLATTMLLKSLSLIKPGDFVQSTNNFEEYEFWKGSIVEKLQSVNQ